MEYTNPIDGEPRSCPRLPASCRCCGRGSGA